MDDNNLIYSKKVKAGKRTYFLDVKMNKQQDYYLVLTESRRVQNGDNFVFEKSKMILHKEDLNKFSEAFQDVIAHIKTELLPDFDFDQADKREEKEHETLGGSDFSYK